MAMDLKEDGKALLSIHEDFFVLDKEAKLARIDLAFDSLSDIFSPAVQANIPILNEEFTAWLFSAFDAVPDKYKLDITVSFNDMEGYSEESLKEIFRKNILLALRVRGQKTHRQNRLALTLCILGLVFILATVLLGQVWTEESTVRDIVFFILDIVATVPFWGAMEVYLIDGSERRKTAANIRKRFNSISFRQKE